MENSTASPSKTTTTSAPTPTKRKHSEFHDPDYDFACSKPTTEDASKRIKLEQLDNTDDDADRPQQEAKDNTAWQSFNLDSVAKLNRFEEIVRAEFQKELLVKEQQLSEIDARLQQARHLLDKLRYHVVSEYYRKQQVTLTAADVAKVRGADTLFADAGEHAGAQLPLHPAIKKIVGKRPVPIPMHLPERTAATLAKETIRLRNPANRRAERRRQKKIRQQGIVTDHSQEVKKQPADESNCDELPCTSKQAYERQLELETSTVPVLNTSRLNNKNRFHFIIGNTSKYIGGAHTDDAKDNQSLAYKWLVYVQGRNLPQPVEAYIKKVRFQLHHSYRPNDIVDICAPPFQLTRRGWGEFPMRIQLYFQEQLQQKPVQLVHTILLDKTMCGLHTMGGETTVEVWLRSDAPPVEVKQEQPSPAAFSAPTPVAAPAPASTTASLSSSNLLPLPTDSSKPRTISITQNKEELDDNLFACINKIELSDDIEQIEPTVIVSEPLKLSSPKKIQPAPTASSFIPSLPLNANGNSHNRSQRLLNGHAKSPPVKNVVFQKAGKLYIIDPLQSKLKQAAKQQSLLKPQLSLLKPPTQQLSRRWHLLQCIQHDHGYANMSCDEFTATPALSHPPLSQRLTMEQLFSNLQFHTMRTGVEFLLRRLPLTDAMESKYPFGRHSRPNFQAQPALRQRFFEYMRGRVVQRCLRQHRCLQQLHDSGKEHYWSVREIVAFARLHGYTPPLKMLSVIRDKPTSANAPLSERVQQQLKEDLQAQLLEYCSLTSRSSLDSWIAKQLVLLQGRGQSDEYQQPVDVIGVDTTQLQVSRLSLRSQYSHTPQMLYLPPPEKLEAATQLVRDMCKDVGIVLDSEQCVPGVSQSLALTLLAHVLRMFVEKLVRRAAAAKLQQQHQHQPNAMETLPSPAANVDLLLQPYDIGCVIARSGDLDFLGNCYLGVANTMDNQS